MKITDLHKIAGSLASDERELWISLFHSYLEPLNAGRLEDFIVALYTKLEERQPTLGTSIIAYGAGNMAREFLPNVLRNSEILEIWDTYSNAASLYGIPIVRPCFGNVNPDVDIVIFIEDSAKLCEVVSLLKSNGYTRIYSYRDYIIILEAITCFPRIEMVVNNETRRLLYDFIDRYAVIYSEYPQVNYSVIHKKLESLRLDFGNTPVKAENLSKRLSALLTIANEDNDITLGIVRDFLSFDLTNAFTFAYQLELFLRRLLANGIKTRERPIRMTNDIPYDQFAVCAALQNTIEYICGEPKKALYVIELLKTLSPNSVPLISIECYYLIQCQRLEDALQASRGAMIKEPNGLLASETFYHVAICCKEKGITVTEPLPDYDLSERYCWSGLTFALCYGFDSSGAALFLPCFRTLQCAANPSGEFWQGDEWVEFRKSLLDGSFKYCQKNNCSNISAGWLPKKAGCNNNEIQKIINGNFTVTPSIDELHFSYDSNCNLKCHSCRLEIKTNSVEQNASLDILFEKNLRPLLKNAKHLCLSGCGEAIISPHSKRVLQSLSRAEYPELAVELRTNVFSFNTQTWNSLGTGREVIKHVAASIDSSSKELFEKLRYPAKWSVVLQNLAFIQQLRNTNEIDMFEFHVVVQTENIDELVNIIKMAIDFDADTVTFSRLVNWRGMPEYEYREINPFREDNSQHSRLMQVIEEIKNLRDAIENGDCELTRHRKKKLFINMHCVPDPNPAYDVIRVGELKIR